MNKSKVDHWNWENSLQEVILHSADEDIRKKIAVVRERLQARLKIMTAADAEEREALEDALIRLTVLASEAEQRDSLLRALQA
jgi:hypothetical protein